MAITNQERIGKAMTLLRQGLARTLGRAERSLVQELRDWL